jgi:hypothetical protein
MNSIPTVHVRSPTTEGIELLSPLDPAFDSVIYSLFRGDVEALLRLKPFITIVGNSSKRTVVAFALSWKMTTPKGTKIVLAQHKYPDALTAISTRGNEIRSRERRIVAREVEINNGEWTEEPTANFYLCQFADWFARTADLIELRIDLDAAILDDGTLLGPDESELAVDFVAHLEAKQTLYREIIDALDTGSTMEEAFRPVQRTVSTARMIDLGNPLSIYGRLAAEDVHRWRVRYGERAVDLLRKAIRNEPFVIGRTQPA